MLEHSRTGRNLLIYLVCCLLYYMLLPCLWRNKDSHNARVTALVRPSFSRAVVHFQYHYDEIPLILPCTHCYNVRFFFNPLIIPVGPGSRECLSNMNLRGLLVRHFYRPDAIPSPKQQCQSSEAKEILLLVPTTTDM